jgi:predicted DNA-binding transcriptional regulator AlpA
MKSKKHGNEYSKAEVKEQLTIEQVCALVRCSAPTLYRRIKHNPHGALFPSPYKVAATADRGPRHVNRWEQAEVMAWLLKGNAPKWRENTIEIINRANTLDAKMSEAHDTDREPWYKRNELVLMAVSGGLLAGIVTYLFGK